MHGWQANLKRTCASPVTFRVLPENEIPPVWRGDFYFCLNARLWICGHSAKPSAVIDGILGVVGWASKNLLNDGFYAAKSTKQGENGKNLRLFVVFDYATWPGSASSVAYVLALPSEKSCLLLGGRTRRAYAMFHSDQEKHWKHYVFQCFFLILLRSFSPTATQIATQLRVSCRRPTTS